MATGLCSATPPPLPDCEQTAPLPGSAPQPLNQGDVIASSCTANNVSGTTPPATRKAVSWGMTKTVATILLLAIIVAFLLWMTVRMIRDVKQRRALLPPPPSLPTDPAAVPLSFAPPYGRTHSMMDQARRNRWFDRLPPGLGVHPGSFPTQREDLAILTSPEETIVPVGRRRIGRMTTSVRAPPVAGVSRIPTSRIATSARSVRTSAPLTMAVSSRSSVGALPNFSHLSSLPGLPALGNLPGPVVLAGSGTTNHLNSIVVGRSPM